ncbi:hypothetical protein GQ457_10G012890 [Hibiscus cannabinus]
MASARYAMVSTKSRWKEQGFYLDDSLPNYGLEQFVHNRLRELGWFIFACQPARANYNWVLEFYANNADGEDSSMVRGRRVPATTAIINNIFGLPNDAPSFYAMMEGFEEEDYEVIKNILCLPNTKWNTTGRNPNSVSRLSLLPEAKLWNTFVKHNLLPTSHNQTVDRTRLLLVNTIMTGFRINVGEILANELAAHCANDKGILAFPCLISALCRRENVSMFDTDKYQPEKTGWTRAVYMRKMNVADAAPLNMAMPTPPASPVPEADARMNDSAPPSPAEPPATAEQHRTPPLSPPVIPSPRDHLLTLGPVTTTPTPAAIERPTPDSPARKRGKVTAGRTFGSEMLSSLEEEEANLCPAKRRRYHVITADSCEEAVLGLLHMRQKNQLHFKECMIQGLCENSMVRFEVPGNRLPETGSRQIKPLHIRGAW